MFLDDRLLHFSMENCSTNPSPIVLTQATAVVVPRPRSFWNDNFICDQLQNPPPTAFDTKALTWFGKEKASTWIFENRFQDFLEGE